jgi:hypothetical protein
MSVPDPISNTNSWPAMLTWQSSDATRLESVRVNLSGNRVRAYGRIIAAANDDHEAFSVSYDLVTNEEGITERLSASVLRASGDQQMSVSRDAQGGWLVQTISSSVKSGFNGALDVDMQFSAFFNTLLLRRAGLHRTAHDLDVPVMYLHVPELELSEATLQYRAAPNGIRVVSPVSESVIEIDPDGFILDYPGLSRRV